MRTSSSRAGGLMTKREDRIKEAASLHVKIGQLQRYCELMVELGQVTVIETFRFDYELYEIEYEYDFLNLVYAV